MWSQNQQFGSSHNLFPKGLALLKVDKGGLDLAPPFPKVD
jgi:hypothetical protein